MALPEFDKKQLETMEKSQLVEICLVLQRLVKINEDIIEIKDKTISVYKIGMETR
jgi:hypothetical protein